MTGLSFRNMRQALGLTQTQLARLMGYGGNRPRDQISKFERSRKVPPRAERLIVAYSEGYRPADWPEVKP